MDLSVEELKSLLERLDEKLGEHGERAAIQMYGGAVMCLVFGARAATKDIDAVYQPKSLVRELALEVADEAGISADWLNDGVKGFVSSEDDVEEFAILPHLTIWAAKPEYVFAMKCRALRDPNRAKDMGDVKYLKNRLGLKTLDDALEILSRYYRDEEYDPRAWFILQELFDD